MLKHDLSFRATMKEFDRTIMNLNSLKTDHDYSTATSEQRAYPRVATCNLISYAAVNRGHNQSDHRVGRALDVSQVGIYLETARRVKSESLV